MDSSGVSVLADLDQDLKRDVETAARILKEEGAKEVYLFGSAAKGKLRPDSDIDLAISGLPPERFYHAAGTAMLAISRLLDVIDLDRNDHFVQYLREKGELVRVE